MWENTLKEECVLFMTKKKTLLKDRQIYFSLPGAHGALAICGL